MQALLEKGRLKLKATATRVTNPDGRVFIEEDGMLKQTEENSTGFVVDTKPDLSVGRVASWLYLAGQDVAADQSIIRDLGVSRILNVGTGIENSFPDLVQYSNIEILDLPEHNIIQDLNKASSILEAAKLKGEKCLVHCNAGVSRAPTVVIGYLMLKENLDFIKAFDTVKRARPCINPNPGFIAQLRQIQREKQ